MEAGVGLAWTESTAVSRLQALKAQARVPGDPLLIPVLELPGLPEESALESPRLAGTWISSSPSVLGAGEGGWTQAVQVPSCFSAVRKYPKQADRSLTISKSPAILLNFPLGQPIPAPKTYLHSKPHPKLVFLGTVLGLA